MRELAIFERQGEGNDIDGTVGAWGLLFKEFVSLTPLTGRELLIGAQIQSRATHLARLHWSPEANVLKTSDRFKFSLPEPVNQTNKNDPANFRIFNIEDATNVNEANRELQLMCVEPG